MKKIIVPTDFSLCALNAVQVAADIARKMNSELHLVHLFERPMLRIAFANGNGIKNKTVHEKIESEYEVLTRMHFMKDLKIVKHIFTGIKIFEALCHRKFDDAGLIVMGSHGTSGWRGFFIGSNTEKVIRYSSVPVLVIKEATENFEVNNIVFASDFFEEADNAFIRIEKFASSFAAKIHLLKVITPGNFEQTYTSYNQMRSFARRHDLSAFSVNTYNDESVEDGVLNFSRFIRADLISMETHGRTGLAHLVNGSITENVANHIQLPVLSVKMKYEPAAVGNSARYMGV